MSESSSHERGEEQGDDVFTGQVPCGFLCKLFQQPIPVFVFQPDEAYPVCIDPPCDTVAQVFYF